ncbi:MAG TPA: hypothetical protein DGG95_06920, partial [Cytophagales bacterium]|nr:hypothetical protein [Cytophagales bacterium]
YTLNILSLSDRYCLSADAEYQSLQDVRYAPAIHIPHKINISNFESESSIHFSSVQELLMRIELTTS